MKNNKLPLPDKTTDGFRDRILGMTNEQLSELYDTYSITGCNVMTFVDELSARVSFIGEILDSLYGIDSYKGKPTGIGFGTPNRRSWRYKLRKAVGYTYP